jgi:hypothetical protein
MRRVQHFFSGVLLTTFLLGMSMLTTGCYTKFATTDTVERIASPSEIDVESLVENGANVTINNYYDSYYARVLRPTIYGFWGWYDPFWGYPLWYTPVVVPIAWYGFVPAYYGWGFWGWNRWGWNPYFPPYWSSGGVASTEPFGTRRIGLGRTRITSGIGNTGFLSTTRYGASSSGSDATPSTSRRQREGTTSTAPADVYRRSASGRTAEKKYDAEQKERSKGYSESIRRPSSSQRRTSSYSAPPSQSSPPTAVPSRSGSTSSSSSSSGVSGRRQR